ncbi:DUF4974 domain-containing protein [Paraflavitalea speifideaquila]|uniref:DUF4974 domain-containing protein n=1 Tax=Paraflavitalea speifideaquila TaxID=3076558 RepID=UPI0028E1A318|nr:DUF4974 domain-containing protein [Paraflavitalea speifideiaquila]
MVRKNDPAAPKVILRQHEKLVYNKKDLVDIDTTGSKRIQPLSTGLQTGISITMLPKNKPDSIIKETSWLYNKLNFDGDSFEELAIKMERWFDVKITINSSRLKHTRLKGSFENETIRQALDALQIITPFEYKIEGKEIVVE